MINTDVNAVVGSKPGAAARSVCLTRLAPGSLVLPLRGKRGIFTIELL